MSTKILSAIEDVVRAYIQTVSGKYNIDPDELERIWKNLGTHAPKPPSPSPSPSPQSARCTCAYTFTRGKKKGLVCGAKCKSGSYCSLHKKYNKSKSPPVVNPKMILRKHKVIDKYWNPYTKLVFESLTDKIVIGKYDDNEIIGLSPCDIQTCIDMGYAYKVITDEQHALTDQELTSQHVLETIVNIFQAAPSERHTRDIEATLDELQS